MTKIGTVGETVLVSYTNLLDPGDNVRSTLTDIDQLAHDISEVGLLQPITVEASADRPGKYKITAGFRRHAAIGQLIAAKKWAGPIECHVRTWDSESHRLLAMLIENLSRVDLNPVDEALGIQRLVIEHGLTPQEVATRLNRSVAQVKDRIALCALPERALAWLNEGRINLGAAAALAKAPEAVVARLTKHADPTYEVSSELYVTSAVSEYNRSQFANELKKLLKETGAKVDTHQYSPPKGYTHTTTETITSIKALKAAIALWEIGDGCITSVRGNGAKSAVVQCFKPIEATDDDDDGEAFDLNATTIDKMPDDESKAWWQAALDQAAHAAATASLNEQRKTDALPGFIAGLKSSDVAAILIGRQAEDLARNLANACRQLPSEWAVKRLDQTLPLLGLESMTHELLATCDAEYWMKHFASTTKNTVRAAAANLWLTGRQLEATFAATLPELEDVSGVLPAPPAALAALLDWFDPDDDELHIDDLDNITITLHEKEKASVSDPF